MGERTNKSDLCLRTTERKEFGTVPDEICLLSFTLSQVQGGNASSWSRTPVFSLRFKGKYLIFYFCREREKRLLLTGSRLPRCWKTMGHITQCGAKPKEVALQPQEDDFTPVTDDLLLPGRPSYFLG